MRVSGGNRGSFKFFQKTKNQFISVCRNEVQALNNLH